MGGSQGGLSQGMTGSGMGANGLPISDPYSTGTAEANTQQAMQQQQNFMNALQQQGGLQNQANVFNQQQALSNQFGQVAAGQGPNPAQAQLQQATGQNVAAQAALAANQRGASSNVGLMQRQSAQTGANVQQQAVGQGATLQAQQSLAAMQGQAAQQQAMQQVAGSQIGAQGAATSTYGQEALGQQGIYQSALTQANAQAIQQQQVNNQLLGAGVSGFGSMLSAFARGGQVPNVSTDSTPSGYADGGDVSDQEVARAQLLNGMSGTQNPNNYKGQNYSNTQYTPAQIAAQQASPYYVPDSTQQQSTNRPKSAAGQIITGMSKGGKVKNMVSGGHVPGQAKVKGDSYKNDTVKARLSPGEIVIPRSIAQHPDAPEMARNFVRAIHAKKGVLRKA